MATKPNNIITFYSSRHGYVQLVKRSVGYYSDTILQKEKIVKAGCVMGYEWLKVPIKYWRGQLVKDWSGSVKETGESWDFYKGQIVWLNSANFSQLSEQDYLDFEDVII